LDNVVSIMFNNSRREFYHNVLKLPFAIGDYTVVEVAKFDIYREHVQIRYPTEEWEAVKLDELNTEFSTVSAI